MKNIHKLKHWNSKVGIMWNYNCSTMNNVESASNGSYHTKREKYDAQKGNWKGMKGTNQM